MMDEIWGMAEEIADIVEEYPNANLAEVVDKLVRAYAAEAELTHDDEGRLRDEAWDRVNDRRG